MRLSHILYLSLFSLMALYSAFHAGRYYEHQSVQTSAPKWSTIDITDTVEILTDPLGAILSIAEVIQPTDPILAANLVGVLAAGLSDRSLEYALYIRPFYLSERERLEPHLSPRP